jgi:hypothetical protein
MHPSTKKEFERYKTTQKRGHDSLSQDKASYPKATKTVKQTELKLVVATGNKRLTKNEFDSNVCNFITDKLLPLSTVEAPSFQRLVNPMLGGSFDITLMSRRTLGRRITDGYSTMIADLKAKLSSRKHKCLTADIWSANHKSYLGVTVHWINDDFTRGSGALACRRMVGIHDYSAIATALNEITVDFGIPVNEVTKIVTDNASNFSKAFKEFAKPEAVDNDDEEQELDIEFVTIELHPEPPVNEDDDIDDFYLPPQERCAAHSLNLVGASDARSSDLNNTPYSRLYNSTFGKAQALWNKYQRSSKAADTVKQSCGRAIVVPGETRWNSRWDAVNVLLQINSDEKLNEVCRALELPIFKPQEIEFLTEWVKISRPVAMTLDYLQGNKNSYYGMLLPKLNVTVYELTQLAETVSDLYKPFVTVLLKGIQKRFPMLELQDSESRVAVLAAVSNPMYKLRWVPPANRNDIERMFLDHVRFNMQDSNNTTATASAGNHSDETSVVDEFHMFQTTDELQPIEIDAEGVNYLADTSKELSMLQSYPKVRKLFFEMNTTLPSSAAVERLFSAGGLIHVPRRNKLSDGMFEKLLLLKSNEFSWQ